MNKINGIYNNYAYTSFGSEKPVKKDDSMSENLKKITKEIGDAKTHDEIEIILENAVNNGEIEQLENLITYRCGDYLITDMLRRSGEMYAKTMKELSKKDISIMPKYVGVKNIDDYTVLIEKIPGMNGKDLVPYSEGYKTVDDESKAEAFKDVQKLVKAGLICQTMLRGDYAWYIVSDTKKLIVPGWKSLRPIDKNEGAEILNKVHESLFRK